MEKNKIMLIVIMVLLVVLLGATVAGGIYLYNTFSSTASGEVQEEEEEEEPIDKSKNTLIEIGDAIQTNLLVGEDQQEHIIRINLSIDVKGEEDDTEATVTNMNNRIVVIRDIINGILRKKTFEELKKVDGTENLKDEILDKLRKEFDTNSISSIYVNDIFLQ